MAVDSKLSEMAELERLGVAQVIQYADDVLEAWTNDGERFLVSGCCTAFTHWKRLRNSCEQTHHYTHFCLSAYKKQMAALVQFRNCYSERPFLCSSLVNDKSRSSLDNKSVFWPQSLSQARPFIISNGLSFELKSREGSSVVILHQHAQSFTVRYRGQLCFDEKQNAPHSSNLSAEADTNYCWVTQRHSVMFIPECWQHPVSLLLRYRQQLLSEVCIVTSITALLCDQLVMTAVNTQAAACLSPLPYQLLSLIAVLMHTYISWQSQHSSRALTSQGRNHRVKVMYSEGILYRLFADCHAPCVEITPSDSVLMRSDDMVGRFFQSWSCLPSGEVCTQFYCNDHLPPAMANFGYSVSRALGQGRRLLATSAVASTPPCWEQLLSAPQMPTVVLESMDIPGLGSFTAYKSGWVRMCFLDRSVLDFHCPELAVVKQPSLKVDRFTELDPHMCRLMLPNGRYEMFSVTSPLQFAWYAQVATRWTSWVSTPKSERGEVPMGEEEEEQEKAMKRKVMSEIDNIQSALEQLPSCTMEWNGDRNTIQEALARTQTALDKTDKLLHKSEQGGRL